MIFVLLLSGCGEHDEPEYLGNPPKIEEARVEFFIENENSILASAKYKQQPSIKFRWRNPVQWQTRYKLEIYQDGMLIRTLQFDREDRLYGSTIILLGCIEEPEDFFDLFESRFCIKVTDPKTGLHTSSEEFGLAKEESLFAAFPYNLFPLVESGEWKWQNRDGDFVHMEMFRVEKGKKYQCLFGNGQQIDLTVDYEIPPCHMLHVKIKSNPSGYTFLRNILGYAPGSREAHSYPKVFLELSLDGTISTVHDSLEGTPTLMSGYECWPGRGKVHSTPIRNVVIEERDNNNSVITPFKSFENTILVRYLYEAYSEDDCERKHRGTNKDRLDIWFAEDIGIVKIQDAAGNYALLVDHN